MAKSDSNTGYSFRPTWGDDGKAYGSRLALKTGAPPLCMKTCPNCGGICKVGSSVAENIRPGKKIPHICADCSHRWEETK